MHSLISALVGGALIGLGASVLLLLSGRIAGISGIVAGLLPGQVDRSWRFAFVGGLVAAGVLMTRLRPDAFAFRLDRSTPALVAAGLLVGFGTRLGSGCTSGHGVCGVSRLSKRSLAATLTFMATGAVTVYVVQHFFGGRV